MKKSHTVQTAASRIGDRPQRAGEGQVKKAMIMMVTAMLFVPGMDALSKLLSTQHGVSPAMITWFRFAGQSLVLLLIIPLFFKASMLKSKATGLNILRGCLVGIAVTCFFVAIKYLPLADAIAIFFVEPLILMVLSALFLGEKVGWRRSLAALFGFAGALLVIQPTYADFGVVSFLPLATATIFAFYLILTRKLGSTDSPLTMQFWAGVGGTFICSLMLLIGEGVGETNFSVTMPQSMTAIILLLGVVIVATSSHLLIVSAFAKAPASILAPFQYLEIIAMTILGYWLFEDFPSPIKWVGILMIIVSGAYVFYREQAIEASNEKKTREGS